MGISPNDEYELARTMTIMVMTSPWQLALQPCAKTSEARVLAARIVAARVAVPLSIIGTFGRERAHLVRGGLLSQGLCS